MHAGGNNPNQDIARFLGIRLEDFGFFDHADRKTGQVILILRVEARHFCRFASNQRRAGLDAAVSHTGNNLGNFFGDIFPTGNIIQEYQRLRTAADNIIDAHRHTVNPDRIVLVQLKGQLELGPYAISAGNQHRPGQAGHIQFKQTAEPANPRNDTLCQRAGHVLLHQLNRLRRLLYNFH